MPEPGNFGKRCIHAQRSFNHVLRMFFHCQIDRVRSDEMRVIRRTTFLQSISTTLAPIIPVLATATSVLGYM